MKCMAKPIRTARVTIVFVLTLTYFYLGDLVKQTATIPFSGEGAKQGAPALNRIEIPSLADLVQSDDAINAQCPIGTAPVLDTISNSEHDVRRIPRILHFTSKTRCVTIDFMNNINRWRARLPNHSIYFHDDRAVKQLTDHPISQKIFPLLNETLKCVTNGSTKSDLWRYLVLYLYGGVYSDLDNSPEGFDENTISNQDDLFAPLEALGIPAQYFIASSPGHPLLKLSLEEGIHRLRETPNVMNNNPAITTGPGAYKTGFINFMNNNSSGYVTEGRYDSIGGRSVTVRGSKHNPWEYINRQGVDSVKKQRYYEAIGTKHFFDAFGLRKVGVISCMEHLRRSKGTHMIANYIFDGKRYVDAESGL